MSQLGAIAGDVGRIRYDADSQKRIYLFGGDIREGLTSADVLQLPQQAMPIPGPGGPTSVDISPFDPTKWLSLRAYDVGLCSMVPSQNVHPFEALGWAAIANQFVLRLDRAFEDQYQAVRTEPATFTPVFHTALDFDPERDGFRISGTYHADKIPVTRSLLQCDDVTFNIAADVDWSRTPATITFPPQCLSPSEPGEAIQTSDGQTWDFPGVVHSLSVQITSQCSTSGSVESRIESFLRGVLVHAFNQMILDDLLVDPMHFGVQADQIRPCTCDIECSADFSQPLPYAPGRRDRCKMIDPGGGGGPCGECWVQLDPDRIQARPEGLEIVLAEDESDPQASMLVHSEWGRRLLCQADRLSVRPTDPPAQSALPGTITVPLAVLAPQLPEPAPEVCRVGSP